MTANDLYCHPIQSVTHALYDLFHHHFVPELGGDVPYDLTSPLVDIRTIFRFEFDGRRYWSLCTVWFDGDPIMIIQNAGREGEDHRGRYVTDYVAYRRMLGHLVTLMPLNQHPVDLIELDVDHEALTRFYGNHLGGDFEPM